MIDRQVAEQARRLVADIVVTSESGLPVAVVEVKNRPGLTAEIAASIRRNLIIHHLASPLAPYFLIISQDTGWLWAEHPKSAPEALPTVGFPTAPIISGYTPWLQPSERLSGGSLEFVVANWLSDLALGRAPELGDVIAPLSGTGFLEALGGAGVTINERV